MDFLTGCTNHHVQKFGAEIVKGTQKTKQLLTPGRVRNNIRE